MNRTSKTIARRQLLRDALTGTVAVTAVGVGTPRSVTMANEARGTSSWPQFYGPQGTGVAITAGDPPERWSAGEGVRWRTPIAGRGWSSPVTDGRMIYVTAAVGNDDQPRNLVVHQFDFESGRLNATFDVFRQADDRDYPIHQKNSHASPTLVIDGDRLFVHFGYQGTAALTTDGKILWTNRDLTFPPVHGGGGSPILLNDQLVFTCDGAETPYVASLDAATGKLRWRCDRPVDADRKFSFATPAAFDFDDQNQIIAPGSDCVMGIDPATGQALWTFESSGFSVVPKPLKMDDRLLYCTGFMRPSLIALRVGSSSLRSSSRSSSKSWAATEVWRVDKNVPKTPTPIPDGDAVVMVSDEGIVSRIAIADGSTIYRERLGGKFSASPITSI